MADFAKYRREYIGAASFLSNENGSKIVAWFNDDLYHSPAITLGLIANAVLLHVTNSTDHRIITINHPLGLQHRELIESSVQFYSRGLLNLPNLMIIAMSWLQVSFVLFLITERIIKAKHLQTVSGARMLTFWIATFVWDSVNYFIAVCVILVVLAFGNVGGLTRIHNVGYTLLVLLLYGWASVPLMYAASYFFNSTTIGYIVCLFINTVLGCASILASVSLHYLYDNDEVRSALHWILTIFLPQYNMAYGIWTLIFDGAKHQTCVTHVAKERNLKDFCLMINNFNYTSVCCPESCGDDDCEIPHKPYLSMGQETFGLNVLAMVIQGFVFFLMVIVIDSGFARAVHQRAVNEMYKRSNEKKDIRIALKPSRLVFDEDEDVMVERLRLKDTPLTELIINNALVTVDLEKHYGDFVAVNKLSMALTGGECFGLLGVNGAGKTTTFRMLTGDTSITDGCAFIGGHNVSTKVREVQRMIGYCPQFDALIDHMTVKETLWMYSRLRGVPENLIGESVDDILDKLLMHKFIDAHNSRLSGGNRRKVSTAIALVGNPPVVFLDEPTTGMDPVARRQCWEILAAVRASGRTLLLTSHSMEECEALCTRLAIMVNGQFKCLGSPQHLKNKFGDGYTLMIKVRGESIEELDDRVEMVINFIQSTFPNSIIKDLHVGMVHYHIKSDGVAWGKLFGTLEKVKESLHIDDYSVSQTTLEQVFISFARAQNFPSTMNLTTGQKMKNYCGYFCNCCPPCK